MEPWTRSQGRMAQIGIWEIFLGMRFVRTRKEVTVCGSGTPGERILCGECMVVKVWHRAI